MLDPIANQAEALELALQYHRSRNFHQAEQIYRQILHHNPDCLEALHLLGTIAFQMGHPEAAIEHYQQVLALDPDYVWVYNDMGIALRMQGQIEAAIAAYRKALTLKPDCAESHYNLGNALQLQDRCDEAILCQQQAIALKPDFSRAHYNLGRLFHEQGDLTDAMTCYERAIVLNPEDVDFRWNLAIALLTMGELKRGFAEYEWRWQLRDNLPRPFSAPLWEGSPLAGKTILLHAEQGFGDTLQFIRYATLVAQRGGQVVVECQPALIRLLATVDGVQQVVARGDTLPDFQVHAPLLSLPRILGTELQTVPAQIPYLKPPAIAFKLDCSADRRLKIGLVWAGNPKRENDQLRSCTLAQFSRLLNIEGIAFYSLQKGPKAAELSQMPQCSDRIQDLSHHLNDFADTAAIVAQLDLVITVDTAVAHLAGGLGKPTWVLLSHSADWRWLLDRVDNPWYPSMRLFRQKQAGKWEDVVNCVAEALQEVRKCEG